MGWHAQDPYASPVKATSSKPSLRIETTNASSRGEHDTRSPPRVASSDFGTPNWMHEGNSIKNWKRADPSTRRKHTRYALDRIVGDDPKGRTIAKALLEMTELLASRYFDDGTRGSSALRVDFFVKWGDELTGKGARIWVNEVENGFNPASLVGWYGERLTLLALEVWRMGRESSKSARLAFLDGAMNGSDGLLLPLDTAKEEEGEELSPPVSPTEVLMSSARRRRRKKSE